MKKSLILFLIFFVNICYSQYPGFFEQNSGVSVQLNSASKPLISFYYYFGYTIGWACGNSGTVIRTTTYGTSWLSVGGNGIPSSANLYSICALDSGHALVAGIVGSNAFVWRTSNLGSNWVQVFSQPGGSINSILFKNANTGFMAGNPAGGRWSLWKSVNSGLSWDSSGLFLPQSGNETGWNNSLFVDSNRIWFGTNNYRIYFSSNFGLNWSVQSTGSEQNIYSIHFNFVYAGPKTGFAGGSNLFKTTDNGLSWLSVASLGTGNISAITSLYSYPNPHVMYSRGNKIYFTSNFGSNWSDIYTAPSGNYTAVANYSQDDSHYQLFFVRTNGGISVSNAWEGIKKITSDVPSQFSLSQNYPNPFNPTTKIKFSIPLSRGVPEGRGVLTSLKIYDLLGNEVATLVNETLQPGTYEVTWDASNFASGIYFYKLETESFTETKKDGTSEMRKVFLIIFIAFLLIFSESEYSQSGWVLQYSGANYSLRSVFFVNQNLGWAVGDNGIILKSTNAGSNWFLQSGYTSNPFTSVKFYDVNTGWISGLGGIILKTTNGGINWDTQFSGTAGDLFSIFIKDQQNIFISGGTPAGAMILYSSNGGFSWNIKTFQNCIYLMSMQFIDQNTGWAAGIISRTGIMLKTTNNGVNWNDIAEIPQNNLLSVNFINQNTGWISGTDSNSCVGTVMKTTNGGINWFYQLRDVSGILHAITFVNQNTGWSVGLNRIIKTTNSGINWYVQYDGSALNIGNYEFTSVFFINQYTGWSVGGNEKIFKTTNGGEPIGINPINHSIPSQFSLSQNYPNPFNPTTKIKFDVTSNVKSEMSNVKIEVFDVSGKVVATLVNDKLSPGTNEIEFDGANYSSGVYFYKLITDTYTESKKMILLK